jgi:hypothetical protein
MAAGFKSGGRVKGTPNRSNAAARAAGGAPPSADFTSPRARGDAGLSIQYLLLGDIEPFEQNARTHSPAQITAIERSLAKFGWTTPMAIAKGVLIYGHARREAAINLRDRGVAIPHNPDPDRAPVVDLSHLSAVERRAYVLADNKLAELAGWDNDLLGAELRGLQLAGFDLSLTGFDGAELETLLGTSGGDTDPDDAPDDGALDGKVCCPSCGHEFQTVSKAFRLMATRKRRAA